MSSNWAYDHFIHLEDAEKLSVLCVNILPTYAVLSVFWFLQGSDQSGIAEMVIADAQ